MIWILATLGIIGLSLKIWAAHRLRQFWNMPGAGICLFYIGATYVQTVLEIYGFYLVKNPDANILLLLRLYYVFLLATLLLLPVIIDIVARRFLDIPKILVLVGIWGVVAILMLTTDTFIRGVEILPQAITRVPGPAYPAILVMVLLSLAYSAWLIRNIYKTGDEFARTKVFNMGFGLALMMLMYVVIIILMVSGMRITVAGVLSLSIGVLLVTIAEQFNDKRVFDLRAITPFTDKFNQVWRYTRHIHTVSVDPRHCEGLMDEYTDSLIDAADKLFTNQRDIASYVGVSQSTVSRRFKKNQKGRK